jgi:nucleotide-binding universal stress UspA family protein
VTIKKKCQQGKYLEIDGIDSSPRLAKKIPSHLAQQYHAIPIASDMKCLTIAMAAPEDPVAREAIRSAVMSPATLVKADTAIIDSLITKYYTELFNLPLKLLAWIPSGTVNRNYESYIQSFSRLLNADLSWFEREDIKGTPYPLFVKEIDHLNPDLLIGSWPPRSILQNLASIPPEKTLLRHCNISIISLKNPRWPIQKILLVLQNEHVDNCAVEWAVRVARASMASLTVLPLITPVPAMYGNMQHNLPELLSSNCKLGRHLRQVVRRLVDWELQGTFKLRDEDPDWQIHSEVSEGNYDLIILGADYQNKYKDLVASDLVLPLLDWAPIPVLISQTYPQGT